MRVCDSLIVGSDRGGATLAALPTSAAANPSLTVAALALRLGAHLAAHPATT